MMSEITITKPFPTLSSIYKSDKEQLTHFLNEHCESFGAIKNLGTFIDIKEVEHDLSIKSEATFLILKRNFFDGEVAGEYHNKTEGAINSIFSYNYNLPDTFPTEETDKTLNIITSSIETYSCPPSQSCPTCKGSGDCHSCNGSGKQICANCSGSGKIKQRDGNYQNGNPKFKNVGCRNCEGTGKRRCHRCNGSKKCNTCNGSKNVTCTRCKGTERVQKYKGIETSFFTLKTNKIDSGFNWLNDAINKSINQIAFDDDLIEWINNNELLFEKITEASSVNENIKDFASDLPKSIELKDNEAIGRVNLKFENVPITHVIYEFEGDEYSLAIVGETNIVCFSDIPTKHSHKRSFFGSIKDVFTKKSRQIAFLKIASHLFNSDENVSSHEIALFNVIIDKMKLKEKEYEELLKSLNQKTSIDDLTKSISVVKGDKRALVFAWQCVLQDGEVTDNEVQAFNELAKLFKIDSEELETLKNKAQKFKLLSKDELYSEYF